MLVIWQGKQEAQESEEEELKLQELICITRFEMEVN